MNEKTNYLSRNCPTCYCSQYTMEVFSENRAENLEFKQLVSDWMGFFKTKRFFSYARCHNCGLLYNPEYFNNLQLEELYKKMPANMDVVPSSILTMTQRSYFNIIKKYSSMNGQYLELGPDVGLLTQYFADESNFKTFWLFEPNKSVHSSLISKVVNRRHYIISDMFSFSQVPNNSIDCIVLIHVLDHLLYPLETLKELKQKLKDDGRIFVVTHDEGSLLKNITKIKWPPFCLQHPQIFNRETIKVHLESAGYTPIAIYGTKNYFPVSFLIKHALWLLGFKIERMPNFFNLFIGLKLGNILTIAERS